TELHAVRIATVFAANSDLELWPRLATLLNAPLNESADACDVERLERVGFEHTRLFFVDVVRQEAARVIAAEAHGGLREVVGAEGEEFGAFRDLAGQQGGARQLDHGPHEIVELRARLLDDFVRNATRSVFEDGEFFFVQSERMHDLR